MSCRVLMTVSVLALSAALGAPFARAETVDAGRDDKEIVIVGTPLDQRAADVLQGVTTLERAQVLETLGQGLGDTLDRQPGMASSGFAAGASRPIVRGLGEDRIRVLSNGLGQIDVSTVSPDHAVTTEGLEADKIEILRGAAAIANGGNAVGGVINVVDSRIAESVPEKALSGQVYGAVVDGLNSQELAGQVTAAFGPLVLHAEGFTREAGDYEINGFAFSPEARADAIAEGADPAVLARGRAPNSFAEAQVGVLGLSYVGETGFVGVAVKQLDSQYGFPEDEVVALKQPGAPFIDMQSMRYDVRAGFTAPMGGLESGRIDLAFVDYQHAELEEGEVGTIFKNEGWEGRIELARTPMGAFKGVFGVTGLQNEISAIGDEAFLTQTEVSQYGVFVAEEWAIDPQWTLEGGLRLERKTLDNVTIGEREFDSVSASLGVSYRPTSEWFLAASLARTQRAPTELELFANGPHKATQSFEIGDANLDQETALSLEGKARFDAGAWRIEASAFYIDFADFITLADSGLVDPVDNLPIFNFLQDDAVFTGGEISAAMQIADSESFTASVDASVDMVRAELDRLGDVARTPPMSWTVGFDGASGPFSGRLEYVVVDDQDRLAAFETKTDGYELINARLSWSPENSERFVIMLDGRNLSDEEVREHTSFVKDLAPRPGRSLRLAVRSSF